ncbi:MAG: ribonuclease [Erysipelotrichaceae bacterium]|nr:ribonuclease [Holdemanella sp.]MCF0114602.1 ribonuclease [Erysipelotrichaceae bacterium]
MALFIAFVGIKFLFTPTPEPEVNNEPITIEISQNTDSNEPVTDNEEDNEEDETENNGTTETVEIVDSKENNNTDEAKGTSDDEEEVVVEYEGDGVRRDGTYDSKDQVALYIYTYGELPSNYMTKKEAKALGWSGGSLEEYAPGMCIGGDHFGNYEGLLPDEYDYYECDIDTLGKKSRGAKRIIFTEDGLIYYTDDHYESFELLYGEE